MIKIDGEHDYLYQWDTGRRVETDYPAGTAIHFATPLLGCKHVDTSNAMVVNTDADGFAAIPNIMLQKAGTINVYAYVDGRTVERVDIEVMQRKKPDDYAYTETEVRTWAGLEKRIAALENNPPAPASPVTRIDSLDKSNIKPLLGIASGAYVLYGWFTPYTDSGRTLTMSEPTFANIVSDEDGTETYVQVFSPYKNCVQYLAITNGTYDRKNIYLNDLQP